MIILEERPIQCPIQRPGGLAVLANILTGPFTFTILTLSTTIVCVLLDGWDVITWSHYHDYITQ